MAGNNETRCASSEAWGVISLLGREDISKYRDAKWNP